MKAYFERVYSIKDEVYCMTVQEPFKDSRGNMTEETYFIHGCRLITSTNELTEWDIIKSFTVKSKAVRYFEKLIGKSS